jgi:hypothetical protein
VIFKWHPTLGITQLVDENNLRAINQAIIPGQLQPKCFLPATQVCNTLIPLIFSGRVNQLL